MNFEVIVCCVGGELIVFSGDEWIGCVGYGRMNWSCLLGGVNELIVWGCVFKICSNFREKAQRFNATIFSQFLNACRYSFYFYV